jgi:hypothetical protein
MLVPVSIIILASQLVIAVADDLPKFDIARGCKIDSASAHSDRAMCTGETTDDKGTPPSYVELLTCLQDQQFARKLPKQ